MAPKNVIISLYPLNAADFVVVSGLLEGSVQQVVLSNITAKGYWGVFSLLRKIDADYLYFPILDANSQSLIPLFKVLAMLTGSRQNSLVMPDLSLIAFGPGSGLTGSFKILRGIVIGTGLLLIDYFRVSILLKSTRVQISNKLSQRVLYIKQTLWLGLQAGGSVTHARGVIKGLIRNERNVDFLSVESRLPMPKMDGLQLLQRKFSSPYLIPRELNFGQSNKLTTDFLLSLPYQRYGAIYQRLSPGNIAGVVLSRIRKIPLIIEYNGSESWLAKNWGGGLMFSRFVEKAENVCLRHAHLVVTVSDVLKDELIEQGIEPERIVNYPNGVDPEEFNSERFSDSAIKKVRGELGVPEDAVLLMFVGTFGHWHGVDFLAQVLTDQAKDNPLWFEEQNIFVCFVGDGVKRKAVDTLVAKCALGDRFKVTGMVSPELMPLYMAASDILLSPHVPNLDGSPFFGSPTKLFEYMASGRPAIASDLFQIGEVLDGAPHARNLPPTGALPTGEQCGVLVEPKSAKDIVSAIEFLVENPKWRRQAGINARQRVVSKFTWDCHTEEINRGLFKAIQWQKTAGLKPTRVLLNALHAKTGGGVTYLKNILPLLAQNPDFEFHLCIHEDQQDILPDLDDRVTLHTFNFKQGFWRLPLREQIDVPRLARKIGADITFSPANYGPVFAPNPVIMLRNALGVAFVERRPIKIAYWLLVSLGTLMSMLSCCRVIAVSKYARDSSFGLLSGAFKKRCSIVPHGVSDAFTQKESAPERQGYILAVSDIYVQKNLKNLLRAIAILHLEKPNIKLKIAGRFVDEHYHQELIDIITTKGLQNSVEFLGGVYKDDLVQLYHHCAVFVFPSTVETFGNPLIEAMASGAPIASSNTAAMPEVAGEAALYFDPNNVEEMASCIDQLLNDRQLCDDLSRKALARSKNYSWQKTAENTLDILYQAVPEAR